MCDTSLYSGSYKIARLDKAVTKILNFMKDKTIDLHSADFITIEKMATLNNIQKKIELSVDNYASEKRKVMAYKLLLRIIQNKPTVTGFLNKSRLFYLTNNNDDGVRLLTKPHLYNLIKDEFPHCFRYDAEDVSDVMQSNLVNLLNFVEAKPYSPVKNNDTNYFMVIFACAFLCGVLYRSII